MFRFYYRNILRETWREKFLTWFLTLPKSSVKVDSSETWTLSKRGCAVFRSITEPSSEKHEEKISNMISYTAKVKCKSWLERDLNAIQARMCSVSILLQNHPQRNMKRKFLTWFLYTAKVKCKSWLERDLNAIQARMCSVSILLQKHPQRNMKRKFLTWLLTLPKSSVRVDSSGLIKSWIRILDLHRQNTKLIHY